MKKWLMFSLAGALSLSAAQPVWEWNFEKKVNDHYLESDQMIDGGLWMKGVAREGAGVKGTDALDCNPKSYNFVSNHRMMWKEFTIELKFKLDGEIDQKNGNTLFWYGVNHFGKRDMLFKITPKKELMSNFVVMDDNENKVLKEFTLTTKPLNIVPGKFYTVKLSSISGGAMKIYFDDVLVAAKDNALSFIDLDGTSPKYYPLLIVGGESRMGSPRYQLNGVIDDFKIYDSVEKDEVVSEAKPVVAEAAEESTTLPLILSEESVTSKFHVLDTDVQGGVVFVSAAQVFKDHAAKAKLKVQGNNLVIDFFCPVSPEYPVETEKGSFWSGELLEFFWVTDPEKGYYQYVYNVTNDASDAFSWTKTQVKNHDWKTNFQVKYTKFTKGYKVTFTIPCKEIEVDPSDKSKFYRANFTRTGKSAGGKSSWANIGQDYHNLAAYGLIIAGDYSDYFKAELKKLETQTSGIELSDSLKKKISAYVADVTKFGKDKKYFSTFEKRLKNLENDIIIHTLAGKKLIVSQPGTWTNEITPGMLTKPIKKFKVRMPQNSTEFLTFALTNMTEKRFLCRIKCMDVFPVTRFNEHPKKKFPLDAGFREAIPHDDNGGHTHYDALAELPLGQVLRIPAKETSSVWLKLSSKGIEPGTYTTNIVIKSATEGIDNEVIPLEVEVVPIDLGKIQIDSAHYNYIQARFVNLYNGVPKEELLKYLIERDVNYLFCNVPGDYDMDIYPPMDKNGNPGKCDFTQLDNNIDLYVKNGMPLERIKLWFYLAMDYDGYCMYSKRQYCGFKEFSPEWTNGLKSFFDQLFDHLKNKYGITPDRVVFVPVDEPREDFNDPKSTTRKAYEYSKVIKSIRPDAQLMANPYDLQDNEVCRNNIKKLSEVYDIICPYSGQLTPGYVDYMKSLNFKEYWTYNVLQKFHGPDPFRRKFWENMKNGFSAVSPYWHVDQADGGDGLCAFDVDTQYGIRRNDYATIFVDFPTGKGMVSRRHEAHYMGSQDAKLIMLCRELAKGKPEAAKVEELVAIGAEGDSETIEDCKKQLLDIALKLQK